MMNVQLHFFFFHFCYITETRSTEKKENNFFAGSLQYDLAESPHDDLSLAVTTQLDSCSCALIWTLQVSEILLDRELRIQILHLIFFSSSW